MKTVRSMGEKNERRKLYVERRLGDVKAHWTPNILFLGEIWALTSYQEEIEKPSSIQRVHFGVSQGLCTLVPREMIVKSYSSPTVRQHKVVTPQKYCQRQQFQAYNNIMCLAGLGTILIASITYCPYMHVSQSFPTGMRWLTVCWNIASPPRMCMKLIIWHILTTTDIFG